MQSWPRCTTRVRSLQSSVFECLGFIGKKGNTCLLLDVIPIIQMRNACFTFHSAAAPPTGKLANLDSPCLHQFVNRLSTELAQYPFNLFATDIIPTELRLFPVTVAAGGAFPPETAEGWQLCYYISERGSKKTINFSRQMKRLNPRWQHRRSKNRPSFTQSYNLREFDGTIYMIPLQEDL
ncbi:hypothetical protein WA026_000333 [Henosepilachna vigintioctopunctata]|uniref:Uncharacterized protein n=1 Tax=Henosepilachna vigintioctopunctata TaxID=420089 RepID=A0AAW1UX84_9CUCU